MLLYSHCFDALAACDILVKTMQSVGMSLVGIQRASSEIASIGMSLVEALWEHPTSEAMQPVHLSLNELALTGSLDAHKGHPYYLFFHKVVIYDDRAHK